MNLLLFLLFNKKKHNLHLQVMHNSICFALCVFLRYMLLPLPSIYHNNNIILTLLLLLDDGQKKRGYFDACLFGSIDLPMQTAKKHRTVPPTDDKQNSNYEGCLFGNRNAGKPKEGKN